MCRVHLSVSTITSQVVTKHNSWGDSIHSMKHPKTGCFCFNFMLVSMRRPAIAEHGRQLEVRIWAVATDILKKAMSRKISQKRCLWLHTNKFISSHEAAHDDRGGALCWGQPNNLLCQVLGDSANLEDVKLLGVEEVGGSHAWLSSIHLHSSVL